eukprot:4535746-Ditylum_brightwellii.AAC.1
MTAALLSALGRWATKSVNAGEKINSALIPINAAQENAEVMGPVAVIETDTARINTQQQQQKCRRHCLHDKRLFLGHAELKTEN